MWYVHNSKFPWRLYATHLTQTNNGRLQHFSSPGLEIATDTVANATNIFSLATKNSGLLANVTTRFFYDLDLN